MNSPWCKQYEKPRYEQHGYHSLITYKIQKTGQPVYLRDLLHYRQPARTLRSSSQLLLCQPATRINFQSKAFSITAPAVWNSLSPLSSYEKMRHHHQFLHTTWDVSNKVAAASRFKCLRYLTLRCSSLRTTTSQT